MNRVQGSGQGDTDGGGGDGDEDGRGGDGEIDGVVCSRNRRRSDLSGGGRSAR
eukprot:CAMPEP_0185521934 /NCGR_PEP_ID=MMETSP1366-20130426/81354_1 /TAXON_ID=38817 /ORGANISM="Gephyrocapsa oceanica, Strain RCC1303" /LENGTH=52 /DNA_ID=CAMNT_0028133139 /DNA_START=40 /DNA_END=195 /DNA_ORIENTATION=-